MDNQDRIFIERKEKTRLVIEQVIGDKIFDKLREKYKVVIFEDINSNERVIFIEEKKIEE